MQAIICVLALLFMANQLLAMLYFWSHPREYAAKAIAADIQPNMKGMILTKLSQSAVAAVIAFLTWPANW